MIKPPVTIETLMKEWTEDSRVDPTSIDVELLKISHLHGKYLNIMAHHRHVVRKLEKDYKDLKNLKDDYFHGHLNDPTILEQYGWEPMQHVHSNPKILRMLENDPDLTKILLRKVAHEEIVFYCETVMKSLNNRSWDLKTYVEYLKYTKG
jgi:hypothetical protein